MLGGPPGGLGVVGKSSRRAGSGLETLSEGQEWPGGPPEGMGVFVICQEALLEGREW